MKKLIPFLILVLAVVGISDSFAKAKEDGNVFLVDGKGGKHFVCPVMGEASVVDSDTKYADHKGKRYYFCCDMCEPKFEADPGKFINKLTLPGNVSKIEDEAMYAVCPVSGKEVEVTDKTESVVHVGKTYYFCCGGCPAMFEKNPAKHLKNLEKKMTMMDKNIKDKCKSCGDSSCKSFGM